MTLLLRIIHIKTIHNIETGLDFTFNHFPYKDHTDNPKEKEIDEWIEEQEKKDEEWKNRDPASIIEIPNKNKGNENGSQYDKYTTTTSTKDGTRYSSNIYGNDVWWVERKGHYIIHIGAADTTVETDIEPLIWLNAHKKEVENLLQIRVFNVIWKDGILYLN